MKCYIATSLKRAKEHNHIRDALTAAGHTLTYDWTTHGSVKNISIEKLAQVGHNEMRGVLEADALIILLPGGKGTHVELGMGIALGKPIILHSECHRPFSLGEEICAFYCVDRVKQFHCPLSEFAQRLFELLETEFAVSFPHL